MSLHNTTTTFSSAVKGLGIWGLAPKKPVCSIEFNGVDIPITEGMSITTAWLISESERLRGTQDIPEPQMSKEELRQKEIRDHPERFTTGKLVRRKRKWTDKKNWKVTSQGVDGGDVVKYYCSLKALADERGLSHNSLRHMVSGDRAGLEIKSKRYRGFKLERVGAMAARALKAGKPLVIENPYKVESDETRPTNKD